MTPEELKKEMVDLVDYYYEQLEEIGDLRKLFELNWYCKDRLMNIGFKAFNETWDNGWSVTFGTKENEDETK
jgi:hypothetical protein